MKQSFAITTLLAFTLAFPVAAQAAQRDREAKGDQPARTQLSRQDRNFIENAMHSNHGELALAKIAQEKASSDQVKQFAKKLLDDHSKAGSELETIVSRLGYTPSKKAMREPREVKKFANMSGERFDREFARQMVKDHKKTVDLFEDQAQDGQTQELWQFAQKTLPTLQEHLRMSQQLAGEKAGRTHREERREDRRDRKR